jgi:hypothetical protein
MDVSSWLDSCFHSALFRESAVLADRKGRATGLPVLSSNRHKDKRGQKICTFGEMCLGRDIMRTEAAASSSRDSYRKGVPCSAVSRFAQGDVARNVCRRNGQWAVEEALSANHNRGETIS